MSLYPGDLDANNVGFEDCMAEAIEQEMESVFKNVKGMDLPLSGKEDRKMLFVAISRGILKYLQNNQGAFLKTITLEDLNNNVFTAKVKGLELDIIMEK
jgi:hypothetical protein